MYPYKILIACEESQRVCLAFRNRGFEAYSCDIQKNSGKADEYHIQNDVLKIINGRCKFKTLDGIEHKIDTQWDLIIAHPPCTYLTTCCNRAYSLKHNPPEKVVARYKQRDDAIKFFVSIANADCDKIAIENPQGYMNTHYRKPDMVIHPYYFAKDENDKENYHMKKTCFWLKNLPVLYYQNTLPPPPPVYICQGKKSKGAPMHWHETVSGPDRAKIRSKTFPGIANAIAEQWGNYLLKDAKENKNESNVYI